ncbi:hypothetical protein HPP92_008231 [Vanilla planifolia]|uniref:DNA ligase n=1 Tax=Vanilla planifolia TaxID=51239 RepID=A0A835RJL6_VANPL|nr:hypothetical protein HPP92_008231 [Vanilla planifolia]
MASSRTGEGQCRGHRLRRFAAEDSPLLMDTESVTTSSLFLSSFSTFAAGSLQVPPPLSVDLLSRGSPLPTPPSSLLASKLIPNTRFVVDGFRAAGDFSISYFLSHYHSDHYNGLNPNWCRGIIFCSEITARFLVEILKVSSLFVCHLPLNRSITIDGNNVILVDANHCPGAVQFLFEVGAEKYIHTGDFRFRDSMKLDPFLQKFVGAEAVFLDTTYCNPKFVFPPQEESVDYVVNTIRRIKEENQASSEHVLFLVATYVIGKERILLEIAKRCNCRLYADDRKMEILSILGFHDSGAFTDDASGTDIHVIGWNLLGDVWPYFRPNFVKMTDIMVEKGYSKAVGFISTGWVYEMRKGRFSVKIKDSLEIHLVPYSEHSSYDELREYVRFLRPKRVIPTVGRDAEKMDGRHLGSLQKHFSGLVDETANKHTFLLPFHQNEVIADAKSGSFNPASMNQPVDSVFSLIGEEECPLREVVMKEGNLQTAMEDLCNFLPSWVDEDQILSLIMDAGGDVIQAVSEFYDREIEFFKHSNSSALPAPDSQTNLANDFSPYLNLKFTEGTQSLCNGSMSHCNNKTIGKPNLVNSNATKRKVLGIDKKTKKNKKFSNSSSCGSKQSTITKFFGKFVATSADDAGSVMVSSQDSLNEVKHNIVATAEPYRHELDLFLQVTNNGIERNAAASLMEKAKGDIDVALDLYYCDPFHVVDKEDTLMRRSASGYVNALSCSRHPRIFRAKNPDAPGMSNFGASTVDSSVVKVLLPIEKYLPIEHACWKAGEPAPYLHLARTFEIAEQEKGKIKTAAMFCNMFRSLLALSPADVLPAVYLCTNRIAADHENMELNIGGALVIAALEEACGTNKSRIKEMYNSFGDLGDVAQECRQTQKLLALPCPLSIQHVFQMLRKISVEVGGGSTLRKKKIIVKMMSSCREMEMKFLVRTLVRNLRIGAMMKTILPALAQAVVLSSHSQLQHVGSYESLKPRLQRISSAVAEAYDISPNLDLLIPSLLTKGLEFSASSLAMVPGMPIPPMLARIVNGVHQVLKLFQDRAFTCEYKYDGQRAQIHKLADGSIRIFSRKLKESTFRFPDLINIITAYCNIEYQTFILDSEIVAVDRKNGNKIMSFQDLSSRERGSKDSSIAIGGIKVDICVFIFDIMFSNGERLLDSPLRKRREYIKDLIQMEKSGFLEIARQITVEADEACVGRESTMAKINDFLEEACHSSCEGIMVKSLDVDAGYSASKRSETWLKVKRDYVEGMGDSLDLVPIGAWHGNGRKAGWYSPFLMACYDPDSEVYQSVCRVMSGFSDSFYVEMKEFFSGERLLPRKPPYYHTDESPDVWFSPEFVWEILGSDFTVSPVHHAAFGLLHPCRGISVRLPRFIRARSDKKPEDGSTPYDIAMLFQAQTRKMEISKQD